MALFLLSLSFLGRSRPKRGSGVKRFREPLIRFYSYQKYIVCTLSCFLSVISMLAVCETDVRYVWLMGLVGQLAGSLVRQLAGNLVGHWTAWLDS